MKVLLVNPPSVNIYGVLGNRYPPLGLAYLAASLRERGYEVGILDLDVDQRTSLDLGGFDVVGITSDTPRYERALEIAKEAKDRGCIVVMGGYHVTFRDEGALSSGYVDYVVRGEGEETFPALLDVLSGKGCPKEVGGISFEENGRFLRTPDAPPPQDLDSLPMPARDLLPMSKYHTLLQGRPATSLITSRGCPFNCYFCASSTFGGLRWRPRSPKSIVDEIEHLYREYGYRAFAFMDDNFTLSPRRVVAFIEELDRRGLDISWYCFSRVDTIVRNPELVTRMAEAGAVEVFLGLESGSQEALDSYGKRITVEQEREAIAILRCCGIKAYGSFIIGGIRETREMTEQTIRLARELDPWAVQFSILTPYPGTGLFEQARRENRIVTYLWRYYDGLHAVLRGDFLSPHEVQELLVRAYNEFFLRGRRLLWMIRRGLRRPWLAMFLVREGLTALRLGRMLREYRRKLERSCGGNPLAQ